MPSNGYCEGQTLNRIIPKAIICALTGKKLQLQGGGVARKSYLHGDDISRAIMLVAREGKIGDTYNCGSKESTAIITIVSFIAGFRGKTLDDLADIVPERTGQDMQYLLDSRKIEALGWHQEVSFLPGLERMVEWFEKYPELLTMDTLYRHRS